MTGLSVSFALVLYFTAFSPAQTPYGGLVGRVVDPSGASVPQATVLATNLATNVGTRRTTNTEGNYEFRELIPGRYSVVVEAAGFKRFEQSPVDVRVSEVLTLDVPLVVGPTNQTVQVTASAPLLQSTTASVGTVLDNQRIEELPRAGDSIIYMLQLSPAVVATRGPSYWWMPNNLGSTSLLTVGGAITGYNLYELDGNPVMMGNGSTVQPVPEMIQELAVQTNTVDATVGRLTGMFVNMVTKSGTNQLHGDVVETVLNKDMMAKDYFTKQSINNPATGPVTPQKIDEYWPTQDVNRFRFSVGGPLYIPHVYDGRNRTFWSFGFDKMKFLVNTVEFSTVPTQAERQGDFSSLLALGPAYQLYDPATTTPIGNGIFQRQPIQGNIIPKSRLDPIALKMLNYWELPDYPGTIDGRNNWEDPGPDNEPLWQGAFRFDQSIGQKNRLFASGTFVHQEAAYYNPFMNILAGSILHRRQKALGLGDSYLLRPDLVLDLHLAVTRYSQETPSPSDGFNLSSLGWPASLVSAINAVYGPGVVSLPGICMPNYMLTTTYSPACGGGGGDRYNPFTRKSLSADLAWEKGNHSLRFGYSIWNMANAVVNTGGGGVQCQNPTFNFDSTWTGGPLSTSPATAMGGDLAAYLLGLPTTGAIGVCPTSYTTDNQHDAYVQDNWKLTKKLTLNLGVRYELDTGAIERYNRTVRGFDFTTPSPISAAASANYALNPVPQIPVSSFKTLGGLLFPGVGGTPRGLWNTRRDHFAPRLGLAYLVSPTTVLRASYSLLYEPLE